MVKATQERKPRNSFHEPWISIDQIYGPWTWVSQTGKQGENVPPQASQDLPQHPSKQTIPLWSAIWEIAWDMCKGAVIRKAIQPLYPKGWDAPSKGLEMDERALELSLSCVQPREIHGKLSYHLLFTCVCRVPKVDSKDQNSLKNKVCPHFRFVIIGYNSRCAFVWNQWKSIHWLACRPRKYRGWMHLL